MKKCLTLIFVIAIMVMTQQLSAQKVSQVEEHMEVLDCKKMDSATIRFTVSIDYDSALCNQIIPKGECYVISQKVKKYIFVDIKNTPNITMSLAEKAFQSPGQLISATTHDEHYGETSISSDFNKVKTTYQYSKFPWLNVSWISADGYYYKYNKSSLTMEKSTPLSSDFMPSVHIYLLWLAIIGSLIVWFIAIKRSKLKSWYKNVQVIAIFSMIASFMIPLCINGTLLYGLLYLGTIIFVVFRNEYFAEEPTETEYNANFCLMLSVASLSSLLFWWVNQYALCYLTFTIFVIIISAKPIANYVLRSLLQKA